MIIKAEKLRSVDLTEGNIVRQLIAFAMPILLSEVFQNLYNSVDSIVVGNCVGVEALASVTSSTDISQMIIGFFTGLSAGSGVLFSRCFGAKDQEHLHRAIHTSMLFSLILGIAMAVLGIVFTPLLLRLVKCPEDVYDQSMIYLRIYLIGVFLTSVYNIASGVLRSVGDSRTPFYYLILASCMNVFLDLLLVAVFGMGVAGVAIATILSQAFSSVLVLRRMLRTNDVYRLVPGDLKIEADILKEIMILGMPAGIQSCIISFSNLFVQRYLNSFGSAAMAGAGAAKKIDKYLGLVGNSIGLSVTTFVSQNVGAKDYRRAFSGIKTAMLLCLGFNIVIGIPIYYFAPYCVRLFTDNEGAIYYGTMLMHVMIPLFYAQFLHNIFVNVVRGFGKSVVAMITAITAMVVCRQIFLAIAMNIDYRLEFVFFAYPFGWICAAVLETAYFLFAILRPIKKSENKEKTEPWTRT
ncbi:MAG: MATE family efflux transporter [Clostridiales bacterium]|nr:MATE family efflux transporter [Clostridiales bacterium]